ncbi:MAG: response regulator [Proteobacteria bacterium]|nr:response regulator [Pseudomonadota bacterium]
MNIRTKILGGYVLLAMLFAAMSFYTLEINKAVLVDMAGQRTIRIARKFIQRIDQNLSQRIEEMRLLNQGDTIGMAVEASNLHISSDPNLLQLAALQPRQADHDTSVQGLATAARIEGFSDKLEQRFIRFFAKEHGQLFYQKVAVYNRFGLLVGEAGDPQTAYSEQHQEWWDEVVTEGIHVCMDSSTEEGKDGRVILIAVRISNQNGEFVGVIKALVPLMSIIRPTEADFQQYQSTTLRIMDTAGNLLYASTPFAIGTNLSTEPFFAQIQGQKGYFPSRSSSGQETLLGYVNTSKNEQICNFSWIVVLENNSREILAEVRPLEDKIYLAIALALLSVVIMLFIMNRNVTRPLRVLRDGANRVADGDLDIQLPVSSADEIGHLAEAFNQMTAKLAVSNKELHEENQRRREAQDEITRKAGLLLQKNQELISAHDELDSLFHTAVDGKRLVDLDFNQLRTNDTFIAMSGLAKEDAERMKCHQVFCGPLCNTDECPIRQFKAGAAGPIEREITMTRPDGKQLVCLTKAVRLNNPDGSFRAMIESFLDITDRKQAEMQLEQVAALKSNQNRLSDLMHSDLTLEALARNIITFLCQQSKAQTGLIYLADEEGTLRLAAGFAHRRKGHLSSEYRPGEGLVGQAALEKKEIIVADVPENYFTIESGLGETIPRHILVKPILHNDKVTAVIELGTLHAFDASLSPFLDAVNESIAVAIESSQTQTKLAATLAESQGLTEELQAQQEELRAANEELEEQTERLQETGEELRAQQEELEVTNEELAEKNDLLDRQKQEVERARQGLEEKAAALALASKYKSEFLANMSHELRTPLNSLLLLAQGLERNREGNLTEEQVESARIIHGSGSDLLTLINEILDLSKIEAGRTELQLGTVRISDLAEGLHDSFQHLADEKGIELKIIVTDEVPVEVSSDRQRLEQIIRNLMSNALKFTESGSVTVTFGRPAPETDLSASGLSVKECLAVAIKDSGIGIATEQRKVIFEAFQQADGSTSRKYGGTGLGLSISKELASLLGGEIQLESKLGSGSTFTLYLPNELATRKQETEMPLPAEAQEMAAEVEKKNIQLQIPDDRDSIAPSDRVMLIIEDDPNFARLLYKKCHEKGLKCLVTPTGEAGLELATKHHLCAVILDLGLPGMDGWNVLSSLKENTHTRHIPVHIVSAEEASTESLRKGAVGHITKPVKLEELEEVFRKLDKMSPEKPKRLLVVDNDPLIRREIVQLIGNGVVKTDEAGSGQEALAALRSGGYDCVVLDLGLPDMDGSELLTQLENEGVALPPVVVYTARDLTMDEEALLREHAESIVIKDVRSQERLLDEVSLFLHRVVSQMPEKKQQVIHNLHDMETVFKDKKVLVVDDDMRTTFAVARLLAESGMKPIKAANGEKALQLLDEQPDIDLVLMDIMMPVMDGYETMQRIRNQDRFRNLPIIVLSAKAMPEDRNKCLAAGANDYLPKPLDQERLFSMMRVWLCR